MSSLVAIHQPNFFPWLGYFDKIRRADIFVILDEVDYPRRGSGGMGSWSNRVMLPIQGKARWITCPVRRIPLGTPIKDVVIDDTQRWRSKLLKTLEATYARAKNFEAAITLLRPLILNGETGLASFNFAAIERISTWLGLEVRFCKQSELRHEGAATALLVSLVRACGGDSYLTGGGAGGYQEDHLFAESGIDLVFQHFVPTPYGDLQRWLPGVSVIDYLMHDGRPLADGNKTA